jgi:HAD superfamily hydrolase (TIGR01450 family)
MTLLDRYDGILLDLDGTVYRGRLAIPEAVPTVHAVHMSGRPVGFITNNASRGPAEVAAQLTELGFDVQPRHVVTSAQAGAALLAERLAAGDAVLVVGTDALADEVRAVGLAAVRRADGAPADSAEGAPRSGGPVGVQAVVQGHSPHTGWPDLAEACLAIRAGALWVACNVDPTLPTERGELPGNGAMVAALRAATGLEPVVAGKPQRRLLDQAAARLSLRRPLVVGDRLDTDVAGAHAAGMNALLVLTGVSRPAELLSVPPPLRPRYVAADLSALLRPAEFSEVFSKVGEQPSWRVELRPDGTATLSRHGDGDADALSALRALCAACWSADIVPTKIFPADRTAHAVLPTLGL